MNDDTKRTIGVLVFAGVALVFLATLLPSIVLPASVYALFVIGLFLGAYLIGTAQSGPTF